MPVAVGRTVKVTVALEFTSTALNVQVAVDAPVPMTVATLQLPPNVPPVAATPTKTVLGGVVVVTVTLFANAGPLLTTKMR